MGDESSQLIHPDELEELALDLGGPRATLSALLEGDLPDGDIEEAEEELREVHNRLYDLRNRLERERILNE